MYRAAWPTNYSSLRLLAFEYFPGKYSNAEYSNADNLIIRTGDMNVDMLQTSNSLTKQYQDILDVFVLHQMVQYPTLVTKASRKLTDHIVTNHPGRITETGILPCSVISDHDGVYTCVNVRVKRFLLPYKFIRNIKSFVEKDFVDDFANLPLSLIYSFEDPDNHLDYFNAALVECLERHAPLRRARVTRPPASWMECEEIRLLQREKDILRKDAHQPDAKEDTWLSYRTVRNRLKVAIHHARANFTTRVLSANRPKEVWRIIHRKPDQQSLRQDPNKLSIYFTSTEVFEI